MPFGFINDVTMKSDSLIVGLDIGTTKVCAVVGEVVPSGSAEFQTAAGQNRSGYINIIGVGTAPSRGMKKGVITNIEHTVDAIKEAVRGAESMAGVEIKAVHVGITGGHIGSMSSHGVIAVKEKEIGRKEVASVIEAAKAVAVPFDREMLHVIPVGFKVNGQDGISDPRGMGGVRLEADVQIVTGDATSVQNMLRCCEKAGLEVLDIIFEPLASADAVLTEDEKDLGVVVIDIGGGTTDLALYHEGNICHSAVLSVGGNSFTGDLAIGLRIPTHEAEAVKKRYGCTMISLLGNDEEVEIGHINSRTRKKIPRGYLIEILQPRAEELFNLLREEILGSGYHKHMNSGVVLTGGCVLMEGMDVMAENILELPVRIGGPSGVESVTDLVNDPAYSTGVGLMMYGAGDEITEQVHEKNSMIQGLRSKVKGWFR